METSEFLMVDGPERYGPSLGLYNPWVWITAILLLILIVYLTRWYCAWRWSEDRRRLHHDAVEGIYQRIHDRARRAAAAPRNKVQGAAADLRDEVRRLIGPVLVLAPLGRLTDNLDRALEGRELLPEPRDPHGLPHSHGHHHEHGRQGGHSDHGGHGRDAHGHDHDGGHDGHGDHGGHGQGSTQTQTQTQAQAQASQISITIGGQQSSTAHPPSPPAPPPPPPPPVRDIDRLRAAVIEFSDYWSRAETKAELRAAQRALITVPPAEDKHPKISGGH